MSRTRLGVAAVALLAVLSVVLDGAPWTPVTLVAVTGILLGLDAAGRAPGRRRPAALAALAAVPYALRLAGAIAENLAEPPEWDFMGFWLHARSAVSGASFYDPASAAALASRFAFSEEFRREIVQIGFWYPPPSMFLFAPLGWFEPHAAIALWYALQLAATAGAAAVMARVFLPGGGLVAVAACAAMVLVCHGTLATFVFAQTNGVALLALALFWPRRDGGAGGAWLALAALTKPFLAALAGVSLLAGRWRVPVGACAAAAALTLAALGAFGRRTFADYLAMNQMAKPDWIFREAPTQSLLSLVLRATGAPCGGLGCLAQPWFVTGAVLVVGVTLALVWALRRSEPELAHALALAAVLLLYPLSGLSYSVLLIPALLALWRIRDRLPGGPWTAAVAVAAIFALAELHDGTETVFAFAAAWLVLAAAGLAARGHAGRAA
jgi:hypothetical protein